MNKKSGLNEALDDSNWHTDFEKLQTALKKYLGNEQEVIVGMLGKNNATSNESIYEKGFCFLTDKATYFIGKVWQKKSIFTWKSNIQYRIVNTEMKGIRINNLFPWHGLLFLLYTIFSLINAIIVEYRLYLLMDDEEEKYIGYFFLIILIMFILLTYLIYGLVIVFVKRMTTIDLEFTNQIMRFQINQLGQQEIKDFYKTVSEIQEVNITN